MSDANGIVLSDLLGLSQPLTKLVETVGCGIGKIYEPWHIERLAKARAREIEIISEAISDNIVLPVGYDGGTISISTKDANDLVTRAQNRFLFQEMKKQQNIESVVSNAYSELENVDSVSDTPVEEDWISEFFNCVANISTEKMQILWGKLLAGEVQRPGSFSLRTLEVLKRLSLKEANVFNEISPYILQCKGDDEGTYIDYFLIRDDGGTILKKYNIPFSKIMLLSEAGLLCENSLINIGFNIGINQTEIIRGLNKSIEITNLGSTTFPFRHAAYMCTEAGKEILPIVLLNGSDEKADAYLLDCMEEIKKCSIPAMMFNVKSDDIRQIFFNVVENE